MFIGQICSVVKELDWAAQASLGEVLIPDAIKSSNGDFEKQEKLTKLVSDRYNAYKRNYSGNIKFDIKNRGKNLHFKKKKMENSRWNS